VPSRAAAALIKPSNSRTLSDFDERHRKYLMHRLKGLKNLLHTRTAQTESMYRAAQGWVANAMGNERASKTTRQNEQNLCVQRQYGTCCERLRGASLASQPHWWYDVRRDLCEACSSQRTQHARARDWQRSTLRELQTDHEMTPHPSRHGPRLNPARAPGRGPNPR
jgi:predicted O-linked N-acetylglucosamine transferase (SPINDLY family)